MWAEIHTLPQFKASTPESDCSSRVFKLKEKKVRAKKEFKEKTHGGDSGREEKMEEMKRIESVGLKQSKRKTSGVSCQTERAPRFLNGVTGLWVVDTVPYAGSVFTVRWPYNK